MLREIALIPWLVLGAGPAHAFDWSGPYVGGNVDYVSGMAQTSIAGNIGTASPAVLGASQVAAAMANSLPGSASSHPRGFMAGGQLGYNRQSGSLVYGVEADLQGGGIKGASNTSGIAPVAGFAPVAIGSSMTQTDKIIALGTFRGRLGYARDNWLACATGGLAYGDVRSAISAPQFAQSFAGASFSQQPSPAADTSMRTGWTLGGGAEYALSGQWTARAEYLYYDLGKTSAKVNYAATITATGAQFATANSTFTTRWTGGIVRLGLSYHF